MKFIKLVRNHRFQPFALGAVIALLGSVISAPAMADYTRQCNAEWNFTPQNASQTYLSYNFAARKTVRYYSQVNDARRTARSQIISCARGHWASQGGFSGVEGCHIRPSVDYVNYPFNNLGDELTEALCAANPDANSLIISVNLVISGETGCGGSPISIASNARINCAEPIGDGGSDEAHEEPVIGDGGSWECVGEGCAGSEPPADDPPADDPPADDPPATATYQPLPFFRLPGNDLRLIELSAPNWLLCRQACTDDASCGAWTYRNPTTRSGPVCLIKSRAGLPIPDPCCRSGIKN